MRMNEALGHARRAAGLSYGDVAKVGRMDRSTLCTMEKHPTRPPSENVIRAYEEALNLHRREIFTLAVAALGTALTGDDRETVNDLYASIAGGDYLPLSTVQTTHAVDHSLQGLVVREKRTVKRLRAWMVDGDTAELRVNSAGILAKTRDIDLADEVALTLARDQETRDLYLSAVRRRLRDNDALAAELRNERDSGARWCAAYLLAGAGYSTAINQAMRNEPSRETLRVMALSATGALHVQD